MKLIRVGLTARDSLRLLHSAIALRFDKEAEIFAVTDTPNQTIFARLSKPIAYFNGGDTSYLTTTLEGFFISSNTGKTSVSTKSILVDSKDGCLSLSFINSQSQSSKEWRRYLGKLLILKEENGFRVILICSLEDYLKGVLQSEMPASYHLEALKSQAVTARTYSLHPRIDHTNDYCQVCDSFLCCQAFSGQPHSLSEHIAQAIEATQNQIIGYQDKPILALFSSCSGGHTENFENCFSDLATNLFPAKPIPYLKGRPEGKQVPSIMSSDKTLKEFWHLKTPDTFDSWSPHFKWHLEISASHLESNLHHTIDLLVNDPSSSPFVIPPTSGKFGHIESFAIEERGIAGTAMTMTIKTSTGVWKINKELIIRQVFKIPQLAISRLNSARIFFEHKKDRLGLLSNLSVFGLGWGHGVGLQQTGAQGLACKGFNYRAILEHYFTQVKIISV